MQGCRIDPEPEMLEHDLDTAGHALEGDAGDRVLEVVRPLVVAAVLVLSLRECDVLEGILDGRSNAEIAQSLGISSQTVKAHVAHLLHKLGARNRAHLVTIGIARGVIQVRT